MCMCSPPSTEVEHSCEYEHFSVHQDCVEEVLKFKWIASEQAGRDLGDEAVRTWIRRHWNGYLRDRWLEHLYGKRFWIELDLSDFGLLQRRFQDSPFIHEIVEQLKERGENLSIILWALRENHPLDEIRRILTSLDINSRRVECKLEENLIDDGHRHH